MKINHNTVSLDRFPQYHDLLARDRRDARRAQILKVLFLFGAAALGAYIGMATG